MIALAIAVILLIGAGGLTGWYLYIQQSKRIEPASIEKMAYPLPEKPSIAVLSFDNMSGDPEDEYLADGIAENIITALAKIDSMFVIARNSSFAYKGKPVKIKDVSEELGVQYVLEGSIQRSNDRIRVTAQLIDALTGHHLWADQYDRNMEGLFEIFDEITKKIVTELDVKLTAGDQFRLYAKGTNNLQAWIHFSKGYTYAMNTTNEENNSLAIEQYERALKIDPNFAAAWASLGLCHMSAYMKRWGEDPDESLNKYYEYTKRAVSVDENSPLARALLGFMYGKQRKNKKAISELKTAIALEPNNARFHYYLSRVMHFAGKPDEAVALMKKTIRLSPFARAIALNQLGGSLVCAGRYEEALKTYERALDGYKKQGNIPFWVHNGFTIA
jgi:adenylate cyclase